MRDCRKSVKIPASEAVGKFLCKERVQFRTDKLSLVESPGQRGGTGMLKGNKSCLKVLRDNEKRHC